jgi:hypothetical protein
VATIAASPTHTGGSVNTIAVNGYGSRAGARTETGGPESDHGRRTAQTALTRSTALPARTATAAGTVGAGRASALNIAAQTASATQSAGTAHSAVPAVPAVLAGQHSIRTVLA